MICLVLLIIVIRLNSNAEDEIGPELANTPNTTTPNTTPTAMPVINPDDLEIGGRFLGLQDFSLAGWEAPRLTNPGGRLDLSRSCDVSESAPIRALW